MARRLGARFRPLPGAGGISRNTAAAGPGGKTATRAGAEKLKAAAIEVFQSQAKGESGASRSPTTPPRYIQAFDIVPTADGGHSLVNRDPAAHWVEFGAHAGGKTFVLAYAPMRNAIDKVASITI